MHELSHLIIGHEPSRVLLSVDGTLALRSYNQDQEDEASWLAGCLLLPRTALMNAVRSNTRRADLCVSFAVSPTLLEYRFNITGVRVQARRGGARRVRS
jgi:Zn-dependent peptidase ImmA (M78 family)